MPSTAEPIIAQVQQQFQELVAYVTGPETRGSTAYEVELTLFRRLLALGAALLRLFFVSRAAAPPAGPVSGPDGTPLAYHDRRGTTYYSVFGKLRFHRPAYTAPGQPVVCPLDAALSLPARCYSDLLRELAGLRHDRRGVPRDPEPAGAHPGGRAQRASAGDDGGRGGGGRGGLLHAAARRHCQLGRRSAHEAIERAILGL